MLAYDSISTAITARHLMTPIESALTVHVSARARDVRDALTPHSFDQAPVTDGQQIVGFVTRAWAEQAPPESEVEVQHLASPNLISADAPVGILLRRLASAPLVFVIEHGGLAGFVTPSDLNKQPVRVHFYMLLADLEMTMAALARSSMPDPMKAVGTLSPSRQKRALRQWKAARRLNIDADVLTTLHFADLLAITGTFAIHRLFGFSSQSAWGDATAGLNSFRNQVMHPTREFLGARTIGNLIDTEQELRTMLLAGGSQGTQLGDPPRQPTGWTQPVTAVDISNGRIRIPAATKPIFPPARGPIAITLRGIAMTVPYDPRNGPDRNRSGVLRVGRERLRDYVPFERLAVSVVGEVFNLE